MYTPVAPHETFYVVIVVTAASNLILEGAYINSAHLYVTLDVPILMEQSKNSTQIPGKPDYVCDLVSAIYGARQVENIWGSVINCDLKSW